MTDNPAEAPPERSRSAANLAAAGVRLLAGTDTMTGYVFPGFSLHDELGLLTDAGLSPLDALRAATIEPARHLGLAHRQGSVEEGMAADLVLLDADPLTDIGHTRQIRAVIARGRVFDRVELDRLLAGVRSAVAVPAERGA